MKRASADVGLIFVVYNLRRIINIIGHAKLKEYLKALFLIFRLILAHFKAITRCIFFGSPKILLNIGALISNLFSNFKLAFRLKTEFNRGF